MLFSVSTTAVIRIGRGRGFVVQGFEAYVITVARCLPEMPVLGEEQLYRDLLGPIDADPMVSAECLFYDRVADLAVLGVPGDIMVGGPPDYILKPRVDYEALVRSVTPLSIAEPTWPMGQTQMSASLPLHDRRRVQCTVSDHGRWLMMDGIEPGQRVDDNMLGSPFVASDGSAIGVLGRGHHHPRLDRHLPGWLLSEVRARQASSV